MSLVRMAAGAGVIAGKLYICGGGPGGPSDTGPPHNSVERLDPVSFSWEPLPPMLVARALSAAGVLNGQLYMCSGLTNQSSRSVEAYDPVAREWHAAPPLHQTRCAASAAVVAGRLYVCGGDDRSGLDGTLSSVERLDPAVGTWEQMAPMSVRRSDAAAAAVGDRLYVFGGYMEPPPQRLTLAEGFDPTQNMWVSLPALCQRRAGLVVTVI